MTKESLRLAIGRRARLLRQERRWTQAALARRLGLSQNRLSEVEHGKGSLSAEQLVTLLRTFNVPLDSFILPEEPAGELQNALARLGAAHLTESPEVLPTERLKHALAAVRETLASGEPRLLAALAPVLVNHADGLNFAKLHSDAEAVGLSSRLGWALENTRHALAAELEIKTLPPLWAIRYRRAHVLLGEILSQLGPHRRGAGLIRPIEEDLLDRGIASPETLAQVKKDRSALSRRWRIVTRLRPEDFQRALAEARGAH